MVDLGSVHAARMTLEPGWRWSECIKPVVGTESCQVHHVGTAMSGRLHIEHEDGSSVEIGPGDAYVIEPGHDAWVVGNETFVGYEFDSKAARELRSDLTRYVGRDRSWLVAMSSGVSVFSTMTCQ